MKTEEYEVRGYQTDIISRVTESTESTLIQLPTGGGKTYIAIEIIKKLSNFFGEWKQVLFVAPKIVLMEQTINAFERAKLKPQKIHGQTKYDIEHRVLVSTLHTAYKRKELKPDIIIVDEVHYGFSGQMLKSLIENNKNARIIGLSATPYDQNGKKLRGFELFINDYDVRYLMRHNFLVQKLRQYELVKQDLSHVRIIAGDYDKRQLGEVVCNKNTILEIIETTKEFIENSKKTIVFAVNIAHAELLTQEYIIAGFKARALHSKIEKDDEGEPLEINDEIEKFRRGQTKVLVSVLMLTTGFDVPDADCAVIARPTKSQNLYKQMVGRILRKYKTKFEEKTEAVLLDCGNVIKNLGMPLEPIREVQSYEINNKLRCSQCQSTNLKLSKIANTLYWECKDCGYRKELDSGSYKCEKCHEVYGYNGNFITANNKLYLNCKCGHRTLISEYTGQEKLVEIKDIRGREAEEFLPFEDAKKWVKKLKLTNHKQWTQYCNGLIENMQPKPSNIPSNPHIIYQNKGWVNTADWIGVDVKNSTNSKDLLFNDTETFVGKLEQPRQKATQDLTKIKVYEIAKEAKVSNSEVLVKAIELGIVLNSPQDEVSIETAATILTYITEKWDCK